MKKIPKCVDETHLLVDQLTLSQPRGAGYAHEIILALPDFQTFLRPCILLTESEARINNVLHKKYVLKIINLMCAFNASYNLEPI